MSIHADIIEMLDAGDLNDDIEALAALHRAVLRARGLPYAGKEDEYTTIADSIKKGRMDNGLDLILSAVRKRQLVKGGQNRVPQDFANANEVKIVGKLRPNYLFGKTYKVSKVNPKTIEVFVDPPQGRFSGKTRIPKTALEVVS